MDGFRLHPPVLVKEFEAFSASNEVYRYCTIGPVNYVLMRFCYPQVFPHGD